MSEQTPFELLSKIANASRRFAAGLPAQGEVRQYWSGVSYTLCGYRFVSQMNDVSEIIPVPSITSLPGVKSWVSGVANVRGRLIPVMDLSGFIGEVSKPTNAKSKRMLIVENNDITNGLIVDSVEGMQHFPVEDYQEELAVAPTSFNEFVQGSYQLHNLGWTVLNVRELIASDGFMQVAV